MIKQIFTLLAATLLLCACKKNDNAQVNEVVSCTTSGPYDFLSNYHFGSLSNDSLAKSYLNVWKKLFLERNQMPESFFNDHIKLIQADTTKWNDGISFDICYEVQVGWAIAYTCDQFIIKIDSTADEFGSFPRNIYLSKEQIETAIDNEAFSSGIHQVASISSLQFPSYEAALQYLANAAKVTSLCRTDMQLNDSGHLILEGYAKYKNKENSCITAIVDLQNSRASVSDGPCVIN